MLLFIGLCLEIIYISNPPVGCAIQLCARQADWNIPHRGLASLRLDSCFWTTKNYFWQMNFDYEHGLHTYGHFLHLQDSILFWVTSFWMWGCQLPSSKKKKHFKYKYNLFTVFATPHGIVETFVYFWGAWVIWQTAPWLFLSASLCPGWRIVHWTKPGVFFALYLMIIYIGISKDLSSRLVVL